MTNLIKSLDKEDLEILLSDYKRYKGLVCFKCGCEYRPIVVTTTLATWWDPAEQYEACKNCGAKESGVEETLEQFDARFYNQ